MVKQVKVIIIEQRGETGLRQPGTLVVIPEKQARAWVKNKWAKYPKVDKEEKNQPETKELKFKPTTKQRKRKSK
jgi:hypothetical protein